MAISRPLLGKNMVIYFFGGVGEQSLLDLSVQFLKMIEHDCVNKEFDIKMNFLGSGAFPH